MTDDAPDVHGRTRYILAGEFGAASKLAARMNLSLRDWIHLPAEVAPTVVFERLTDSETATRIVPGSGRG